MTTLNPIYKKFISFFLAIIFPFVLLAIGLDQHSEGYSSTCPICQAKYSFKGTGASFAVEFHLKIVHFLLREPPIDPTAPFVLPLQNKSPPFSLSM
jgi:hypothetical protein